MSEQNYFDNEGQLHVKIGKKNPKPNPPTYKITTIAELFDILTEENVERFLNDFSTALKVSISMREMVKTIALAQNVEITNEDVKSNEFLSMPSFTWIDD